jgi:hypothetical protein
MISGKWTPIRRLQDSKKREMNTQSDNKSNIQLVWGIALTIVGIAVFFKIYQVIPDLDKIQQKTGIHVYIQVFLIGLMGFILTGGGIKKLFRYYRSCRNSMETPESDSISKETDSGA